MVGERNRQDLSTNGSGLIKSVNPPNIYKLYFIDFNSLNLCRISPSIVSIAIACVIYLETTGDYMCGRLENPDAFHWLKQSFSTPLLTIAHI